MAMTAAEAAAGRPAADAPPPLWRQAWEDLQPFPRRAAMTWRVALLCAIVVAVCMMYEIPEGAISCYLVLYLTKPDAAVNVGTGVGFFFGLFGVVALLVWIVNLTIGSTMHVMAGIVVSSVLLLYLGAASQLGEKGGVAALVIAFLLTLIVKAPEADLATFALREAWAMAAAPMALMAVFNLLLGFSPVLLLRDALRARLAAAARVLEAGPKEAPEAAAALRERLREGDAVFAQQAQTARVLRLVPLASARQMAADVRAGFALMLAVSALPAGLDPARRAALAAAIRAAEAALAQGEAPPPPAASGDADAGPAERAAWRALAILAGAPEGAAIPALKVPFLAPDALTNPAYSRFAIKTTLAAVICFLAYTAIDWQDIHTAMITCYVAALGSAAETVHKLALRIAGCLVGAALGFGAIFWVIPHIDGIGSLMALVFAGCLVGAWVSTGPERISYAGVQVALAFLLIVVQGFGPSLSLASGYGRIFGILLGNLVVYVIFTRVWPAPVEGDVRRRLAEALEGLAALARLDPARRSGAAAVAATVESRVGAVEEGLRLLPFEPLGLRAAPGTAAALRGAAVEVEALNREIWLSPEARPVTADRLDRLADRFRAAAAAISGGRPAPGLQAPADFAADPFAPRLARLEGAAG